MGDLIKGSMEEFVHLFDEADRLAAAVIYEEKPHLVIKLQPESYATFQTFKAEDATFIVTSAEFGADFVLESGVSLTDALDFCKYFGFECNLYL